MKMKGIFAFHIQNCKSVHCIHRIELFVIIQNMLSVNQRVAHLRVQNASAENNTDKAGDLTVMCIKTTFKQWLNQ
jgi:hypothetical protein